MTGTMFNRNPTNYLQLSSLQNLIAICAVSATISEVVDDALARGHTPFEVFCAVKATTMATDTTSVEQIRQAVQQWLCVSGTGAAATMAALHDVASKKGDIKNRMDKIRRITEQYLLTPKPKGNDHEPT